MKNLQLKYNNNKQIIYLFNYKIRDISLLMSSKSIILSSPLNVISFSLYSTFNSNILPVFERLLTPDELSG